MKTKWYLKFVDSDMTATMSAHHFKFKVGVWTPRRNPIICKSGWHVSDMKNINRFDGYLYRMFVCIAQGKSDSTDLKSAHERIMLVFEVNPQDFKKYLDKAYDDRIASSGYFTRKGMREIKKGGRLADAAGLVLGHRNTCDIHEVAIRLAISPEFRRYFTRYVNRRLKSLGYE